MPSLGLYLHIPFCKSKCIYCDFYSLPHRESEMDAYCDALRERLSRWADKASGYMVDTVYFGGGTPSFLGAARLARLLAAVFSHFTVSPDAEITLEANPDSAQSESELRKLRLAGFNRLSLGMQSADDAQLRLIGRIHTHADTVRAVRAAREAGFDNISLDLIYGLPEQTAENWLQNVRAALALRPEHLSCYGLKVEPGTPLAAMQHSLAMPDDDAQADCYLAAVELLAHAGYEQYEISNFCRSGCLSRHNSRYWALSPYLGFGPGAHSDFGGERFAYARDLSAFLRGEDLFSEKSALSPRERQLERVMLSLRTTQGLELPALNAPTDTAERLFAQYAQAGLAEKTGSFWHLTPRGFLLSNRIICDVLEALCL